MLADDDVVLQRAFRREALKNGDQPFQETKGRETVNRDAVCGAVRSSGAEAYVEKAGTNLLMKKLDRVLLRLASDRAPSA